ncbi:MAG TPA: AAA domain-containing protein [Vicinamibacterales bacterium]|nr:AAA domain-containing protein [Vicinamibacterales bacterium]
MRERRGSFEVVLTDGRRNMLDEPESGASYTFRALLLDEKLVAGLECTLRASDAEQLVRIDRIDGADVTLWSEHAIALQDGHAVLVIYPWFLYERLLKALEEIDPRRFAVERAMTLFGKRNATFELRELVQVHASLNASQRAAVQLCSDSDLAFVWGPPGTGKTTTLAHIVSELLAQGLRVLVLSTTNAALDQALEPGAGPLRPRHCGAKESPAQPGARRRERSVSGPVDVDQRLLLAADDGAAIRCADRRRGVDQARAIRTCLKERADDQGDGRRIECSTVHRFQGQERDVIILDTVDAEPMKPGVLLSERGAHSTAENLINVAISRARGKLIVVADVRYFERRPEGSVVTRMVARALALGRREILRK